MRIYVASSWRNEAKQQEVVRALRALGHDVYDFRNPGCVSLDEVIERIHTEAA